MSEADRIVPTTELDTDEPDIAPTGAFVKIYASILKSSIWLEAPETRILWITMLASADADGYVTGTVGGLAHQANIDRDACARALAVLEAPDPDSATPDHEGRRIRRVGRGWRILNFRLYREMRTPRQVATAKRVQRHRERQRGAEQPAPVETTEATAPSVTCNAGNAQKRLEVEVEVESSCLLVDNRRTFPHSDTPPDSSATTDPAVEEANTDPVRAGKTDSERALELTIALNQGHLDNPAIGEQAIPALPYTGSAIKAAEAIAAYGIPHEWAKRRTYEIAREFTPSAVGRGIGSIAYVARILPDEWARTHALNLASSAERPATATTEPAAPGVAANGENGRQNASAAVSRAPAPARRDLKGEGLILFGRLRDSAREEIVHNNPAEPWQGNRLERRIPEVLLESLPDAGRTALAAIGGTRAITHPRVDDTSLGWKFAAAYAAAFTTTP